MSANDRQVAGEHYRAAYQHWDFVEDTGLDYLLGQATKYLARWRKKNGAEDLRKARHLLEKYLEVREGKRAANAKKVVFFADANDLNGTPEYFALQDILRGDILCALQGVDSLLNSALASDSGEPSPRYVDQD